jgi:lysophospholipase L1-like esterase
VTRALPVLLVLTACGPNLCPQVDPLPKTQSILALGDSILGIHRESCEGVPGRVAMDLDTHVDNAAIPGLPVASPSGGDDIRAHYASAKRDWVLFSGGGNDLIQKCHCNANVDVPACHRVIERLVSPDGTSGQVPGLLDRARADGARVIIVGYYPLPDDAAGNFDACAPYAQELTRRYRAYAAARIGARFYDPSGVMQFASFPERFDWDHIHPSPEGARAMAVELAALMQKP